MSAVQVAEDKVRGGLQYWGVFFAVHDRIKARKAVEKHGGWHVYTHYNELGTHDLYMDNQGAAFFLSPAPDDTSDFSDYEFETKGPIVFNWRKLWRLFRS